METRLEGCGPNETKPTIWKEMMSSEGVRVVSPLGSGTRL